MCTIKFPDLLPVIVRSRIRRQSAAHVADKVDLLTLGFLLLHRNLHEMCVSELEFFIIVSVLDVLMLVLANENADPFRMPAPREYNCYRFILYALRVV
jgi:hypothetical protein